MREAATSLRRTLQPSTPYACVAQCALLPVAVGAMNIHDVHDRQTSDAHHHLMPPPYQGRGIIIIIIHMEGCGTVCIFAQLIYF